MTDRVVAKNKTKADKKKKRREKKKNECDETKKKEGRQPYVISSERIANITTPTRPLVV